MWGRGDHSPRVVTGPVLLILGRSREDEQCILCDSVLRSEGESRIFMVFPVEPRERGQHSSWWPLGMRPFIIPSFSTTKNISSLGVVDKATQRGYVELVNG